MKTCTGKPLSPGLWWGKVRYHSVLAFQVQECLAFSRTLETVKRPLVREFVILTMAKTAHP